MKNIGKLTLDQFKQALEHTGLFKSRLNFARQPLHLVLNMTGHRNHVIEVHDTNDEWVATLGSISKFNRFKYTVNKELYLVLPVKKRNQLLKLILRFSATAIDHREDYTISDYEIKVAQQKFEEDITKHITKLNANRGQSECDDCDYNGDCEEE